MSGKVLTARYVLDSAGVRKGAAEVDKTMAGIDGNAKKFSESFDKSTSRIGSSVSGLAGTMGSFGLPFAASVDKIGQGLDKAKTTGKGYGQVLADVGKVATVGLAGGLVVAGAESVKMAANFQQSMSKLVTSGGEAASNLKGDMAGVETLMGQTGTSASQLATGLYTINSAGFHGGQGLTVLKAAAEGAKTENADLRDVTDGLTTMLNDYGLKASSAAEVTSKMVMATSLGKTTFQDLAGSLHTVSPAAQAAGLSMNEVLGAMATMTGKGTPAADAATYLRQTILQLSNPSKKAAHEMDVLGLSSIDVSKNLGARGLTGTLTLLENAIAKKMGPAGVVLIDNLKQAAAAGSGWAQKLQQMTPAQQAQIKSLADMGYQVDQIKTKIADGTKATAADKQTMAEYQAKLRGMPSAFRSVLDGLIANKLGYTDLQSTIAKLPPTQQTAVGALATMVGGTKSMQAALELTGVSAGTFRENVAKVAAATTEAGGHVAGWSVVQKNLNQQLAEAKGTADALALKFGSFLIPKLESAMKATMGGVTWLGRHKAAAIALAAVIGGPLAVAIGAYMVMGISRMISTVGEAMGAMSKLGLSIASMSETGVLKLMYLKDGMVRVVSEGAVWAAEHAAMAASYIAENVAMAASATAAFIAENAATLGIAAGVAALIAGIVFLATHWHQVWTDIVHWVLDAKNFIVGHVHEIAAGLALLLGPIGIVAAGMLELATHWKQVWGFMETTAVDGWHILDGVWHGIEQGFGQAGAMLIHGFEALVNGAFAMVAGVLSAASHLPFVGHHFAEALKSVRGFQSDVDGTLTGLASDMRSWGQTAGQNLGTGLTTGLSAGLTQNLAQVLNTTTAVAASVEGAMRKDLQVQSPSRLTMAMGRDVAKGLEIGMLEGRPGAAEAARNLVSPADLAPALAGAAPTRGPAGAGGAPVSVQVTIAGSGIIFGTPQQIAAELAPDIRLALVALSQVNGSSEATL